MHLFLKRKSPDQKANEQSLTCIEKSRGLESYSVKLCGALVFSQRSANECRVNNEVYYRTIMFLGLTSR